MVHFKAIQTHPHSLTVQFQNSRKATIILVREPGAISTNFGSKAHSDFWEGISIELEKAR